MSFHELIYVSLAPRDMSDPDLVELLEQSRDKNARLNITGLLVYHQREFMQLLEGSRTDIFALYETICKDDRNQQNRLLWDGAIAQRSFSDWAMAFVAPRDLGLENNPAYSDFLLTGLAGHAVTGHRSRGKTFLLSLRNDFLSR